MARFVQVLAKRMALGVLAGWMVAVSIPSVVLGQDAFEQAPISYQSTPANDPIARLLQRMKDGQEVLARDEKGSYLPALLKALHIPESSQCLVFSKTSLQIHHIGPRTPRAIYFNDNVYVGFVLGSPTIEMIAVDPQLGCVFYTLEREQEDYQIRRDPGQCLSCHATTRTERVPGVLVRSIFSDKSGRARSGSSSYVTDDRSPFEQRWGGWYVTGQHGSMRHLGNVFANDREDAQKVDREAGANQMALPKIVSTKQYLRNTSDIVALMVLEHQTRIHNLITRANYETRMAMHLDESMNQALGREANYVSDSTKRRIVSVGDSLVSALMMAEEFELTDEVCSSCEFAEQFSKRGPFDSQGRSFYQLDLQHRLFRYPCSYLILSEQFDGLPEPVMSYVRQKVSHILSRAENAPTGVRWSEEDYVAVRDMLNAFKPGWLQAETASVSAVDKPE